MKKLHAWSIVSSAVMIGATIGIPIATAAPASAGPVPSIPAAAQTCSAGQTKLDYAYEAEGTDYTGDVIWSNVCGQGTWTWNTGTLAQDWSLLALRMPTTPYYRIWEHEYADGSGGTQCYYSEDTDIITGDSSDPSFTQFPGNVQVTSNIASC